MIKVTIWNEFVAERNPESLASKVYPEGLHAAIRDGIAADDLEIRLASLDQKDQGLPDELLNDTDVLIWWGHLAHGDVSDELVAKVRARVWDGMGLIVLHSGHYSKIFKALNGTSCRLRWRECEEKCRVWCVQPTHPIAEGVPETFALEHEEMYGEPFMIAPDGDVIFSSWFRGGETFRSGVTFRRENGRIFYFQPGHETYRNYYDENVLRIIGNAVRWCGTGINRPYPPMHRKEMLEVDSVGGN
jgi:trehalose utilization protein